MLPIYTMLSEEVRWPANMTFEEAMTIFFPCYDLDIFFCLLASI